MSAINRNNKAGVGATGNGVLTQVFVDGDKKVVDIAVINTYLAKADRDYDTKKENVTLEVYGLSRDTKKNLVKTITTGSDTVNMPVSSEDFVVENVKKGDTFLVTVADTTFSPCGPFPPWPLWRSPPSSPVTSPPAAPAT